jgi:hypothetical protein
MSSHRSSRRTSFPPLGGVTAALVLFAPARDECSRAGLEFVTRSPWPGQFP